MINELGAVGRVDRILVLHVSNEQLQECVLVQVVPGSGGAGSGLLRSHRLADRRWRAGDVTERAGHDAPPECGWCRRCGWRRWCRWCGWCEWCGWPAAGL